MTEAAQPAQLDPTPKRLLALTIPAILVGMVAGLALWALDETAQGLEWVLWDAVPHALGADPDSGWWIFGILTVVGVFVGIVLWLVPGHGGLDSATVELAVPAQPLSHVPGIALAVVLTLAGGVSLGPEGPIIGIVVAVTCSAFARLLPRVPAQLPVMLAIAGTIGALFGTPVAAALILTGALASSPGRGALWDRLFLPLASAGAGSVVTYWLGGGIHAIPGFEPYGGPDPDDFLWGILIAMATAGLGLLMAWALPLLHRALRAVLRHPFLVPAVGGVILGVLGAIGGPLTLFKGLDQSAELIAQQGDQTAGSLALIVAVKLVALVVSAAAAFRGGRVFPAVFLGIAAGMLAAAIIPAVPFSLAVACGVLGFVLAVGRDGWLAIFAPVAIVGDVTLIPIICIIVLPAWLLVSRGPEMIVHRKRVAPASQS